MADKLNPPIIDGLIQAQAGDVLKIPFQMNRSVSPGEISDIVAAIKTVSTNTQIANLETAITDCYQDNNGWWVKFNIEDIKANFKIGQYYKIQLAYKNGTTGFYSTVGTFKYTSSPKVYIEGLVEDKTNMNIYEYTGCYKNGDSTEKVYSYYFNIYEPGKEKLIATSGELLHNSSTDLAVGLSSDTWAVSWSRDGEYLIEYCIKTINGLECRSPKYRITDNQLVNSDVLTKCDFVAKANPDSGCIELSVKPSRIAPLSLSGQFVLLRAAAADNFEAWHKMAEFVLTNWNSKTNKYLYKDCCVEQGETYIYALQEFNAQGIYSKRVQSVPVVADFEDMYLSDGEHQLRIRFNPKVSSFKNTILESKLDTIGGKYPFFFRNGNVKYKEFPISGLISLLMDENDEFIQKSHAPQSLRTFTQDFNDYKAGRLNREDMGQDYFGTFADAPTILSTDNFRKEREFKIAVLEWLTDGQPKLFRSPGEGNFIVRLMNTSLSPNDTLSRMLHTFSSTAYEMADYTIANLRSYGMLPSEKIEVRDLEFKKDNISSGSWSGNAVMATLYGAANSTFSYTLSDKKTVATNFNGSGVYEFDPEILKTTSLIGLSGLPANATLIYAQYTESKNTLFNVIDYIETQTSSMSLIGNNSDIISNYITNGDPHGIKKVFNKIFYLNIQKRPIINVTETIVEDGKRQYKIGEELLRPLSEEEKRMSLIKCGNKYYDPKTDKEITVDFTFCVSNSSKAEHQHISANGYIFRGELNNIEYLYVGNGLYVDINYDIIIKHYTVEKENASLKNNYEKLLQALKEALGAGEE